MTGYNLVNAEYCSGVWELVLGRMTKGIGEQPVQRFVNVLKTQNNEYKTPYFATFIAKYGVF